MKPASFLALMSALAASVGCHTPVGSYFANRARDLGECGRFHLGIGPGLGGGVRGAGLVDIGIGGGTTVLGAGLTWDYGVGNVFGLGMPAERGREAPADLWLPAVRWSAGRVVAGPCLGAEFDSKSFWLLPVLTTFSDDRWLWAGDPNPDERWIRVHAFDVEVSAWAVFLNVRVGFSPGEFVDFLLGWFGVDLAGDDRAFERAEEPAPGG